MPRWLWIALVVLLIAAGRQWLRRDIEHPPGVLAPEQPDQVTIGPEPPVAFGEFTLHRRAEFDVTARVLSARRYWWGRAADLSPLDLALGWGPMSDQAVLDRIDISQGNRWYFMRYDNPGPLPARDATGHSGNMHMVPADARIEDELLALRRGDVVDLEGFLIDAQHPSGFAWRSSLSREDTGEGSCELFYVTGIRRAPRP